MSDETERNLLAQQEAYGEPLSETFSRLKLAFGLNQAALARILGLSAPMLSQLNSAHRVKIGNPAVLGRLQRMQELSEDLSAGSIPADQVQDALEEIQATSGAMTRTTRVEQVSADDASVVMGIRNLLRAVASGAELRSAAEVLGDNHPSLAEVLRLYGTGPVEPATKHFADHRDLF